MDNWLDVTTTAIPRLTTRACIKSFLSSMDPGRHKLRWIFHLDRYPGLEQNFEANKAQAQEVARMFDAAVLMEAEEQQGFSGSLYEVWSKTDQHVLHIEDDWFWHHPWKLQDVLDIARDGYSFCHRRARTGVTSPSLWKRHVIESVLAAWPKNRPINENWLRIFCHHRMRYRNAKEWAGGVCRPCSDVGRNAMRHFGYQLNPESLNLSKYRSVSPESLEQKASQVWTERTMKSNKHLMLTRFGEPTTLENVYLNGSVFLILSGPSLLTHDLSKLNQRGIMTFAVNNAGCVVRPNIWTFGDSTVKFHEALFLDPAVLKILPKPRMGDKIRIKREGVFTQTETQVVSLPGVVCIERNCVMNHEAFLFEESVCWGNGKDGEAVNGFPRVLSTMVQAIRLCYYLGFRKVFLLGCDFNMTPDSVYAFPQFKHSGGCEGNNKSYNSLNWHFSQLQPHFKKAGFHLYNCLKTSGLTAFPYKPYNECLEMALKDFPPDVDTLGYYDCKDGGPGRHDDAMKED